MTDKSNIVASSAVADNSWASGYHAPVLVQPILELLRDAELVLDGTLGGGGHSAALLNAGSTVIGIDRDPVALATASERLAGAGERFRAVQGNYASAAALAPLNGLRFDGILLDLGISSRQVDDESRGFSFREGAPLDMRMGSDAHRSAAEVLNQDSTSELADLFRNFGDEPRSKRLASEIVRRRENRPFVISDDLVGAIRAAFGPRTGAPEFARLFQAVRIAVNDELGGISRALPDLRDRLSPGGTMVVIAYHSGEDRLVKHAFREWSTSCICPPRHLQCTCGDNHALGELLTRRAVIAPADEITQNPRARSAKLRAWRRNA